MRLLGAVSEGSGAVNEDGYGVIERGGEVTSAWIFDGVTGINGRNHLGGGSDAKWLVDKAHGHLLELAARDMALPDVLSKLVSCLIEDWTIASRGVDLPESYDPPAACLILVKRYGASWRAMRLGDSCLLSRDEDRTHQVHALSPKNAFDHWLSAEARKRRDAGVLDIKSLLAEFRPQLQAGRARRNQPGGYSILECSPAALAMPDYLDLGAPADILLCTDGYYRAVDHYGLYDDQGLLDASGGSVAEVLRALRAIEASDPECQRFLRFKPSDDATAVMLTNT